MKIKDLLAAGLVTLLLLFSGAALPDANGVAFTRAYIDSDGNQLRLSTEPCRLSEEVKSNVRESLRSQLQAAELVIAEQHVSACYLEFQGDVYVVDSNGRRYDPFPIEIFRDVDGAAKAPQGAK